MRIWVKAVVIILLCGCARMQPAAVPELRVDDSLWNLRIIHGGRAVFSGLLLLKQQENILETAVLDSSGLTIMSGRLGRQGEMEVTYCLAPARKHDLPEFLGQALAFVFYEAPDEDCFQEGQTVVCRKGLPPFFLRTARYLSNNRGMEIQLRTPGASLVLRRMEQDAK